MSFSKQTALSHNHYRIEIPGAEGLLPCPRKGQKDCPKYQVLLYIYINTWYLGQSFCPFLEELYLEEVIDPLLQEFFSIETLVEGCPFEKELIQKT